MINNKKVITIIKKINKMMIDNCCVQVYFKIKSYKNC